MVQGGRAQVDQGLFRCLPPCKLIGIELPYQVVIDEAVNLAKQFGAEQGHSFVNGVLDKAARQWRDPGNFSPLDSPG